MTVVLSACALSAPVAAASGGPSFEQRVRAEEAIQRVYYAHQIGAERPFSGVFTRRILEDRVRAYLRKSVALESLWNTPVTDAMLRAELLRMARGSRLPERLREISAALGDDPALLMECLARPALVDRLARSFYARDAVLHAGTRRSAEDLRRHLLRGDLDPLADRAGRRLIESAGDDTFDPSSAPVGPVIEESDRFTVTALIERGSDRMRKAVYTFEKRTWDDWWTEVGRTLGTDPTLEARDGSGEPTLSFQPAIATSSDCIADTWNNNSLDDMPDAREAHTAVWTGTEILVWGGTNIGIRVSRGGRYDPATDTWRTMGTDGQPSARSGHVAVWTGKLMIVWGGGDATGLRTDGGRYDPITDTWSATSSVSAPTAGSSQTAVWTDKAMIVWNSPGSSSGRYDPVADRWEPISTTGVPPFLRNETVVWTGSRMLVWGGVDSSTGQSVNLGFSYDPVTDSWSSMTTLNAPAARQAHSAVWTGREMVVWGGLATDLSILGTGGRYDPSTDRWLATSMTDAPEARYGHTVIWTGAEMIIWGAEYNLDTGGRYDPRHDTWTPTATVGAPTGRRHHTAIWSGRWMIVWGGRGANTYDLLAGGRYDPAADSWTPTSIGRGPSGRSLHTSVWTGNVLIVWGGQGPDQAALGTGGRYDPAIDSWTATSIPPPPYLRSAPAVWTGQEMLIWGAPGRRYHLATDTWRAISATNAPSNSGNQSAVWTGSEMIVWGGGSPQVNTGGRYDPSTDTWSPTSVTGAPSARSGHSGVWTGSRMIIWGGQGTNGLLNSGGQYDPATNAWTATSTVGAPTPRSGHGTVWTGQAMIVWAGLINTGFCQCDRATNTGALYDPIINTWSPMSTGNAPSTREHPGMAWTGSVLVVWGGDSVTIGGGSLSTGGRYHVASAAWAPITSLDAPGPRTSHTTNWTGNGMIVWDGAYSSNGGMYCPGAVPVFYRDGDGDHHGNPLDTYSTWLPPPGYVTNADDCNDQDSTWWSTPSEVRDLTLNDAESLQWSMPLEPGGMIVYYDALSTLDATDFMLGAACSASNVTTLTCSEPSLPPTGRALFFLVRAENRCPQGVGPLGYASDGTPRAGRTCP